MREESKALLQKITNGELATPDLVKVLIEDTDARWRTHYDEAAQVVTDQLATINSLQAKVEFAATSVKIALDKIDDSADLSARAHLEEVVQALKDHVSKDGKHTPGAQALRLSLFRRNIDNMTVSEVGLEVDE